MSITPRARRAGLAAGAAALTGALVLAAPLTASAHVHIDPVQAKAGTAHVDLTFQVPNEVPAATTTGIRIDLPASAGFTTVTPSAVHGWASKVVGGRSVRFTATGGGIGDRQTQTFAVRMGPVPDVGSVPIPVAQTYSNGTVVHWSELTPASGDEPEHPAPTLYVRDTPPPDHDDDGDDASAASATAATSDGTGTAAIVLAATGLGVGLVALVLAAAALVRSRRSAR